MIKHQIGTLHTENGDTFIRTETGKSGLAISGPGDVYEPGAYSITFHILPHGDVSDVDNFCGWADVAAPGMILEKTNLYVDRLLSEGGRVVLAFALRKATPLRFRVFSRGNVGLKVSATRTVAPLPRRGYLPIFHPDTKLGNQFFQDNFQRFRSIYEEGVHLKADDSAMMAAISGTSFYITTPDVFQLVKEIFFTNVYNFCLNREVSVIDIGMNIGLASLYMARNPHVMEVHAFEPFRVPFNRAMENFALNPALSKKIKPTNIGLGAMSEELSVYSDPERTIGRSIRGLTTGGTLEKITIRSAAEIFKQLIVNAKSKNWEIVAKIDCEGSEFPIVEDLAKAGLLTHIRAIMMEWHRKGSPDKSNENIVAPLIENNFVIFDRTNPNRDGGMLYAVRTAP